MARYNWSAIRQYYIYHQDCSYATLSAKFGVSETGIKYYQKRMDEDWQALRRETNQIAAAKLPEKTGEKIAEFQAEKLRAGKYLVGIGLQGIKLHPPTNARMSREIIDSGYKLATEAMNLDKPSVAIQQNTLNQTNIITSFTDIVAKIQKRVELEHGGASKTDDNRTP